MKQDLKFTDKYKTEAISIVPMLTEDGRPLLRIIEKNSNKKHNILIKKTGDENVSGFLYQNYIRR